MDFKTILIAILTAVLLVNLVKFTLCDNPAERVEHATRVDTIAVQVIKHDTLRVVKTRTEFIVKQEPVIEYKREGDSIREIRDTESCYSFAEAMSDGAAITAEICSRTFTATPPLDLRGNIAYVPPPDTQRTIRITDTVKLYKPHLWRDIKIFGFAIGVGAIIGAGTILYLGG